MDGESASPDLGDDLSPKARRRSGKSALKGSAFGVSWNNP
jgi:hypothetical protein